MLKESRKHPKFFSRRHSIKAAHPPCASQDQPEGPTQPWYTAGPQTRLNECLETGTFLSWKNSSHQRDSRPPEGDPISDKNRQPILPGQESHTSKEERVCSLHGLDALASASDGWALKCGTGQKITCKDILFKLAARLFFCQSTLTLQRYEREAMFCRVFSMTPTVAKKQIYKLSLAAIANYHKLSGLRQHRAVTLQFYRLTFQHESNGTKIKMLSRLSFFLELPWENPFPCLLHHPGDAHVLGSRTPSFPCKDNKLGFLRSFVYHRISF